MILNPKIDEIKLTNLVGLDLETSGLNPRINEMLVIALSNDLGQTFVLEVGQYHSEELKSLFERLKSCERVIGHNLKFDGSFIYKEFGITYTNFYDTFLVNQILFNGLDKPNNLVDVLYFFTGKKMAVGNDKKRLQMSFVGMKRHSKLSTEQLEYAGEDTAFLIELYHSQMKRLKQLKLTKIEQLEAKLIPVLVKMEVDGCLIDINGWRKEIEIWDKQLLKIEQELDSHILKLSEKFPNLRGGIYTRPRVTDRVGMMDMFTGEITWTKNQNTGNVNYGSAKQIMEIFRLCNEEPPADKQGKEGVGEDMLGTYVNENPRSPLLPFLSKLLEYREYAKLVSTYGDKFLAKLDENNHIHTSYTQCHTATGRLSSSKPNLQNIPGGRSAGGSIRNFFVARPGYKMVTSDMNSAEVAIAADYSGDKLLLDSILNGADMHSKLASVSFSIIFGEPYTVTKSEEPVIIKDVELVPNDLRTDHKSVLFAKFYKAGAKRVYTVLAKYINLFHPPEDRLNIASQVSKALDAELPTLSQFLSKQIELANSQGYLRGSKLGRIRYWPDKDAYGDAANMPM